MASAAVASAAAYSKLVPDSPLHSVRPAFYIWDSCEEYPFHK